MNNTIDASILNLRSQSLQIFHMTQLLKKDAPRLYDTTMQPKATTTMTIMHQKIFINIFQIPILRMYLLRMVL